jgi:type IV secretory pathway VirB2 component (pilin)
MYRFRSAVKGALLALAALYAAWPVPVAAEAAPEWQTVLERLVDITAPATWKVWTPSERC